jgi:anti-sigma B factor antagonist
MGLDVEIEERRVGSIVILRPIGRIADLSAVTLQTRLFAAVGRDASDCVLDLSAVPYIASVGIRAIFAAARVAAGRRLVVAAPNPVVSDVLKVAHLAQVVPIFDTVAAAEAALSTPPA